MSTIIGIITRKENDKYYVKKEVIDMVIKYNAIPVITTPDNKIINICDGVIFPGGDDIELDDIELIKYLYYNDIPCFGICLGMQEMGYAFGGSLNKISNYNHLKPCIKYVHDVKINKNSKLYRILNKENIQVNSRHKDYLVNTDLFISGISDVIESIEDINKKFFIGVQWHPESMIEYDINSNLIMKEFIEQCRNYQLTKNQNI